MKLSRAPIVALAVSLLAVPGFATPLTISPQVKLDVKQLVVDLEAIASRADVDPQDIENFAAILQLAIAGAVAPSLESVRTLATDAAAALADGRISTQEQISLVNDLNDVLESAGLSQSDISDLQNQIFSIFTSSGVTTADFQLVVSDLTALLADLQGTFVVTTETIELGAPADGRPSAAASGSGDTATIISSLRAAIGAQASVGINTSSLATGTYKVSVNSADGEKTPLGALVVNGTPGQRGVGSAAFGPGGQSLPEGFDAADVASIDISSDDDTPVLTGNTADAKAVRSGSFSLSAGPAGPKTKGEISFQTKEKANGVKSTFLLFARKLPANTKLFLKVNGVQVRKVKTDAKGQVIVAAGNVALPLKGDGTPKTKVTPLPSGVDISSVLSVELDTADGAVVAAGGIAN